MAKAKGNSGHISKWTKPWIVPTLVCATLALLMTGCTEEAGKALDKAEAAVENAADETSDAVKDAAEGAGEAVGDAAESAGDLAKEAGDKLSEGFSAATDKAGTALEGIDGGGELLTNVKNFFGSAQETLSGITSKESAEAAVAKLGDLDGTLDKIGEMTAKLPESARAAIGTMVEKGTAQLQVLMEKVNAIPGVSTIIKPKLDALMTKLKEMSVK